MKKTFFSIAILVSLFSLVLISCNDDKKNSDKKNSATVTTDPEGTYQLVMDGNIVAEGTSTQKVMMFDNTINLGGAGSDFVITITNVPETIGGNIAIDLSSCSNGDRCQLTMSAKNMLGSGADESYWGKSGTVTRTSASKISFEVTCKTDASKSVLYTFSGYVESDVFKVK